jgi:hypothetical protein
MYVITVCLSQRVSLHTHHRKQLFCKITLDVNTYCIIENDRCSFISVHFELNDLLCIILLYCGRCILYKYMYMYTHLNLSLKFEFEFELEFEYELKFENY